MGIRNPGPAYVGKYKTNKGGARWTNTDAAGWSSRCLAKGSAQKPQAHIRYTHHPHAHTMPYHVYAVWWARSRRIIYLFLALEYSSMVLCRTKAGYCRDRQMATISHRWKFTTINAEIGSE